MARDANKSSEPTEVRLYVGGFPPEVKREEIERRFTPFGKVRKCEVLVRPGGGGVRDVGMPIAFLNLKPKDPSQLSRCLAAYNGCKWKGSTLRVELAKPNFLERLRREWTAQKDQIAKEIHSAETQVAIDTPLQGTFEPMYIVARDVRQVLKVQAAGGVKRHRKFTEEDLELLRSQDSSCPVVPEDDVAISLRAERKSQLSLLTSMFHGSDSLESPPLEEEYEEDVDELEEPNRILGSLTNGDIDSCSSDSSEVFVDQPEEDEVFLSREILSAKHIQNIQDAKSEEENEMDGSTTSDSDNEVQGTTTEHEAEPQSESAVPSMQDLDARAVQCAAAQPPSRTAGLRQQLSRERSNHLAMLTSIVGVEDDSDDEPAPAASSAAGEASDSDDEEAIRALMGRKPGLASQVRGGTSEGAASAEGASGSEMTSDDEQDHRVSGGSMDKNKVESDANIASEKMSSEDEEEENADPEEEEYWRQKEVGDDESDDDDEIDEVEESDGGSEDSEVSRDSEVEEEAQTKSNTRKHEVPAPGSPPSLSQTTMPEGPAEGAGEVGEAATPGGGGAIGTFDCKATLLCNTSVFRTEEGASFSLAALVPASKDESLIESSEPPVPMPVRVEDVFSKLSSVKRDTLSQTAASGEMGSPPNVDVPKRVPGNGRSPGVVDGASFVRPKGASGAAMEEAWRSQRQTMLEDFKRKRRSATRHTGSAKKKKPAR